MARRIANRAAARGLQRRPWRPEPGAGHSSNRSRGSLWNWSAHPCASTAIELLERSVFPERTARAPPRSGPRSRTPCSERTRAGTPSRRSSSPPRWDPRRCRREVGGFRSLRPPIPAAAYHSGTISLVYRGFTLLPSHQPRAYAGQVNLMEDGMQCEVQPRRSSVAAQPWSARGGLPHAGDPSRRHRSPRQPSGAPEKSHLSGVIRHLHHACRPATGGRFSRAVHPTCAVTWPFHAVPLGRGASPRRVALGFRSASCVSLALEVRHEALIIDLGTRAGWISRPSIRPRPPSGGAGRRRSG